MRTACDRLCVLIGTGLLSAALLSGNGWAYLEAAVPHPTATPGAWQGRATETHRQVRTRWQDAYRAGSRDLQTVLQLEASIAGAINE